MPLLQFYFLGQLKMEAGGQALLTPPTLKSQSLLAYLVLHRRRAQPRDHLAGLFWGERPEEKARQSLSTALWHIRRTLPDEPLILSDAQMVQFNPQAALWLDVEAFEQLIRAEPRESQEGTIARLHKAVELYRGELLEGFCDDWIINERYRLEALFLEALASLMAASEAHGEHEAALAAALRLLHHDPLREEAYRGAMRAYGRLGQRNAALQQYQRCREIIRAELGTEPMPETVALYRALLEDRFPVERGVAAAPVRPPAPTAAPAIRSPLDAAGASPLVGRAPEMEHLLRCYQRAEAGEGALLFIEGEPGIGKTRLAEELCRHVRGRGGWVVKANCYRHEQALPHGPLADILRGAVVIAGDSLGQRLSSWQITTLAGLASELHAHLPARRQTVLPGESEQTRLFGALTFLLLDLACQVPLLLVLEDLQWAHETTLGWLHHLARHLPGTPLLILVTYRPGEMETPHPATSLIQQLLQQGLASRLRLTRLSLEDLTGWMRGASSPLLAAIYRHTEGNPFFVLEVQRALLEAGKLCLDAGRWVETTPVTSLPIPDSVRQAIQDRLSRLSPAAGRALNVAAVIGLSYDLDILERAWGQGQEVTLEALDELLRRRLVREGSGVFSSDYEFDHHLVRDIVYERLAPHHRRQWHGRVAQALVEQHGHEPARSAEIAYHYTRAEDWEQAQKYLFQAGDQAGRMGADPEALAYYRETLAACERASGGRWEPLQRASLERRMGESYFRTGEHARALEHLERALAFLHRPLPRSPAAVSAGIAAELAQQAARILVSSFLRRTVGRPAPAVEEEVLIYSLTGWINALLSNHGLYLLVCLRALNVSQAAHYADGEALAAAAMGTGMDFIPLFPLAAYFHRRAASRVGELDHPGTVGFVYQALAYHHHLLGNLEAVVAYARRSAAAYQEADDPHRWALVTLLIAYAHAYCGEFDRGLACAHELVKLGQEVGDRWVLCTGEEMTGILCRHQGRLEESEAHLQRAVALAADIPDYMSLVESSGELGKCHLRQGRWPQAVADLEAQQQVACAHGVKGDSLGRFLNALAEAYLAAAEGDDLAARAGWLHKAGAACRAALQHAGAFRPGLPEALRLQGKYEWLCGHRSKARRWWQRSLAQAEAMGHRHDLALTSLDMGLYLADPAALDRARALLAEMGAAWHLARALA